MRNAVAYAAAAWAAIFSALHVVWAMGWPIGLPAEVLREAFKNPSFLAYDLAVAAACALAAGVALACVRPWGRRFPRWLMGSLLWSGTPLLALRSGAGLAQRAYYAATNTPVPLRATFGELWFAVGAVLFVLTAWHYWRGR